MVAGLLLAMDCTGGAAQEMKPPRQTFAQADWPAAIASLGTTEGVRPWAVRLHHLGSRHGGSTATLGRLNSLMAQRFTGIAGSPVPVLLPFDIEALKNDLAGDDGAAGDDRYLAGFHATAFFDAGPAGYDAAFTIQPADVPELADVKFVEPIQVQISGSRVLYELDPPITAQGSAVAALEPEFPGIRRLIIEHSLRYTFMRFGVPYLVSIPCFDTNTPRYKMPTCIAAERVAQRFLRALRFVGGAPQDVTATAPLPRERPTAVSQTFGFFAPGQLVPGTGFRGQGGRQDNTVYSQIRFPLGEAPAYANSEVFQNRNRMRVSALDDSPNISYAWRDNFCERRGFPVAQCPAGIGHQGQDIRPAGCKLIPGTERCEQHGDILAARDGMILRSPGQEAAYLFVNTANEHIRFRYLHMSPSRMDADSLLSGRRVTEGEAIGEVGNFSMKAAGTSYHLHFDIQVPTKDGWVFVSPYMTLVSAYERLIGARGSELVDPIGAEPATTGSVSEHAERSERAKPRHHYVKKSRHLARHRHRIRQARN